jgi:protein-disulfide isomerase
VFQSNWNKALGPGQLIGDSAARVKVVVFDDLECPYCKRFNSVVRTVRKRFPGDVSLLFVHFPLPNHRFARLAARAAECGGNQGRFEPLVDALFEKQDSLGIKDWVSYARDAGIRDTLAFRVCVADTTRLPKIEAGIELGKEFRLRGTPTVLINGWRMAGVPTDSEMFATVASVLNGKNPFPTRGEITR